jgi:hypothetical protein
MSRTYSGVAIWLVRGSAGLAILTAAIQLMLRHPAMAAGDLLWAGAISVAAARLARVDRAG